MTLLNDNKAPETIQQTFVDTKTDQQKVDTTLSQQTIAKQTPENQPKAEEEKEDPNWRAFREARKKDREQREAAERKAAEKEAEAAALKAAMEAAFAKATPIAKGAITPGPYEDPFVQGDETEEQRIERKVNELLEKKEKQYAQLRQEQEKQELPNRLKRDFPDFDKVCSQENLDYLDYHFPEIARPLDRLPHGYDRWHDIYHAVKKLIPNQANAKKDMMRADINMNKPKSISSATQTPTGEPSRQSWQEMEQRRAANWERMQKLMKGVG
jgi:hypothetical protein